MGIKQAAINRGTCRKVMIVGGVKFLSSRINIGPALGNRFRLVGGRVGLGFGSWPSIQMRCFEPGILWFELWFRLRGMSVGMRGLP